MINLFEHLLLLSFTNGTILIKKITIYYIYILCIHRNHNNQLIFRYIVKKL